MKIFYDHQAFSLQKYGGISRYFAEIIKNKHSNIEYELFAPYSNNYYLQQLGYKSKSFFPEKNFKGKLPLLRLLNNNKSKKNIKKQDYDIFHPGYYDPYFLDLIGNKPFICTTHDLTHELFPESFSKYDKTIEWKKELIKKASHIIAVSENTKKDILKFFKIKENKITVIYHGFYSDSNKKDEKISIPNNYLLYVGSRNLYKNFEILINAFADLKKEFDNLNLICVGGGAFSNYENHLFQKNLIQQNVTQINANDNQLTFLYKNSTAFIFPSKYEGFGIPILEAFANKCPVISSNTSSLPEVAGEAAIFFNPNDKEDIKESIKQILNSEKLRNDLIIKGIERLKHFSWKKTAETTAKVYNTI